MAQTQYRPAICGLCVFSIVFASGILTIFISSEEKYKGLGIILSTLGFLGGFASSLYFRRKRKEVKNLRKKTLKAVDNEEKVLTKPRNFVDPLMLRAITHIKFRACDELRERENDNPDPNNRMLKTEAISRGDYVVVNSSGTVSKDVVM